MGLQIIKQPDGRFCVWSQSISSLVLRDATEHEVVRFFVNRETDRVRGEVKEVLNNLRNGQPQRSYFQHTLTYQDVVAACTA